MRMFSEKIMESVIDRLTKSIYLQAVRCDGLSSNDEQSKRILRKIATFPSLRGVYLFGYWGDWSVLTSNPSLSTLTLQSCSKGLLDSSPLLKALDKRIYLQEWKRSESDKKFHLSFFGERSRISQGFPSDLLLKETHLQALETPFSESLLGVLPLCRSITSLDINSIRTNEEMISFSKSLLQAPFIRSLSLVLKDPFIDLSSLPLSSLKSLTLKPSSPTEAVCDALAKSKPHSLTCLDLQIDFKSTDADPLARLLFECPSVTDLSLFLSRGPTGDLLSVFQVLQRLQLASLTLQGGYTDEAIANLSSFLSQSALQDLKVGRLSPKQLQLVADALPSSSLHSLWFSGFSLCEDDSSYLALFSALSSSSLRFLFMMSCSFRSSTFKACLNLIPKTQLTRFYLYHFEVFKSTDGERVEVVTNWESFRINDRHCIFKLLQRAS
jgi:hypothetical protein